MVERRISRRELIRDSRTVALGAAAAYLSLDRGAAASSRAEKVASQSNEHVVYHYDEPYDYGGIMQGFPPPKDQRITVANYRSTQATRRWALAHMRELFPTQNIWRGRGAVFPLRRAPENLDNLALVVDSGEKRLLKEHLLENGTDAFLVLHKGAIITEQYFHGMKPDTPHNVFSLGKSLSVGVVFNLLASGVIKEEAAVTEYIPEWKDTAYEGATIRHLMDMQSGVFYDYNPPDMKTWKKHAAADGSLPRPADAPADEGEYDFLANDPDFKRLARPHGCVFHYKECDARGLLWACEKVTGRGFADLFSEFIWSKLGAEHDAYVCTDGLGAASTSSRISLTLRDLARWGQAHVQGGTFNGRQVLPRRYIDDILHLVGGNRLTEESFFGPSQGQFHIVAYRSQFGVPIGEQGDYLAAGYNGQYCYISPRSETVIVKFSTYGDDNKTDMWKYDRRDVAMCRQICDHFVK